MTSKVLALGGAVGSRLNRQFGPLDIPRPGPTAHPSLPWISRSFSVALQ